MATAIPAEAIGAYSSSTATTNELNIVYSSKSCCLWGVLDDNHFGLFRAFGEAVRSLKILRLPTSSADHAISPESSTQS